MWKRSFPSFSPKISNDTEKMHSQDLAGSGTYRTWRGQWAPKVQLRKFIQQRNVTMSCIFSSFSDLEPGVEYIIHVIAVRNNQKSEALIGRKKTGMNSTL